MLSFCVTGSDYSIHVPEDETGSMSSIHTVLLSVWLHWLFISRALGFNGLHASVGRKSPDSTQVCSPVSSKGCEEWSQYDEKREWDLSAPSLSSKHQDELVSTEKWQVCPRQDTPINVMMPLDVFEMLMSTAGQRLWHLRLLVTFKCHSSE